MKERQLDLEIAAPSSLLVNIFYTPEFPGFVEKYAVSGVDIDITNCGFGIKVRHFCLKFGPSGLF